MEKQTVTGPSRIAGLTLPQIIYSKNCRTGPFRINYVKMSNSTVSRSWFRPGLQNGFFGKNFHRKLRFCSRFLKMSRQKFPWVDFGQKVSLKIVDFLVDFSVEFFLLVFPRKMVQKTRKSTKKSTKQNKYQNPRVISGKGCPWKMVPVVPVLFSEILAQELYGVWRFRFGSWAMLSLNNSYCKFRDRITHEDLRNYTSRVGEQLVRLVIPWVAGCVSRTCGPIPSPEERVGGGRAGIIGEFVSGKKNAHKLEKIVSTVCN